MRKAATRLITLQEIEQITADEGERWGYPHARRVLALAHEIDEGLAYDADAFAYAVYLHDWGAFPRWRQAGGMRDFRVLSLMAGGNQVAAEIEFAVPSTGRTLRDQELHLWTCNDEGKVVRLRHYVDTAKHLAAAPEPLRAPAALRQSALRARCRYAPQLGLRSVKVAPPHRLTVVPLPTTPYAPMPSFFISSP